MNGDLLQQLGSYGPLAVIFAVLAWKGPEFLKVYLRHRREMIKLKEEERRKDAKIAAQIEAAKQRRQLKLGGPKE